MGKVLFVACTNVGRQMIEAMMTNDNIKSEIVGIVNINRSLGLSKANYHTYEDLAEKYNIPHHYCNNINDEVTVEWIKDKKPDIIIQTGWSQKFHDELLEIPKYGCIGEHPAPLPRGRGAACINWAILTGEKEWGDTFFKMVSEYDRGEVYAQGSFEIKEYDNVKTVYDKVANTSKAIIEKNIDKWTEGCFETIALDESIATYYKRRRPSDGEFDFSWDSKKLHDFIRAQTEPYPGAFYMNNGKKITVLSTAIDGSASVKAAGDIEGITKNGGIKVVCGDGKCIELLRFKLENGVYGWFSEYVKDSKNILDIEF